MSQMHDPVTVYAGDTWPIPGTLLDGNGNPIDLTTVTSIDWYLLDYVHNTVVMHLSLGSGVTVITPAAGAILIAPTPTQTAPIAQMGYQDRVVISFTGVVTTEWTGEIIVIAAHP